MVLLLLVMVLKVLPTIGSLKTPGMLTGEKKVTADYTKVLENVVSTPMFVLLPSHEEFLSYDKSLFKNYLIIYF